MEDLPLYFLQYFLSAYLFYIKVDLASAKKLLLGGSLLSFPS